MIEHRRVIPFDRLRMADVDAGRRQERLARRNDRPARGRRHPRPGRIRHDGVRVSRVSRAGRARGAHRASGSRHLDVDDVAALAAAGAEIRGWIAAAPLPPALAADIARRVSRARGDGRRRRPSPCARRLRPRTCPTPRSPVSRKHFLISMAWRIYFMRYRRYLQSSTTTGRSPIASTRDSPTPRSRCRPASSGWCAATSAPRASCSRSTPNPASTRSCSSRRRTGSARPSCRAR